MHQVKLTCYLLSYFIPVAVTSTNDIHVVLLGQSVDHCFGYSFCYGKFFPFHRKAEERGKMAIKITEVRNFINFP